MSRVAAPTGGAAAGVAAQDAAAGERPGRRWLVAAAFLAPAAFFLLVWIVYPTIYTIWRSFFDRTGNRFVGFDNYRRLFSSDTVRTAIENNAIWVAVVPALITAIGLIFAVLTERIRWSVAFKTIVFMPMNTAALNTPWAAARMIPTVDTASQAGDRLLKLAPGVVKT